MNGRLYDPLLHRFLAPDNYVQDPYNTQNFNRYGYVLNNPLMYTDPSGELGVLAAVAIGAAVAAGTYTVTALTADVPFTAGGLIKATLIGGFSGAVTFGIGEATSAITQLGTRIAVQSLAHGMFQGTMAGIQGGNFWHGAASGALASLAASMWSGGSMAKGGAWNGIGGRFAQSGVGQITFGTVSGGAGAALTGGNFWEGAATGFVVSAANHLAHKKPDPTRLKKRIEKDGRLSFREANKWYRHGDGSAITVDADKVDLDFINPDNWAVGEKDSRQLLFSSRDGRVYGNLTLEYKGNNQFKIRPDEYNFEMHKGTGIKTWIRNQATKLGKIVAGKGTSYIINFEGFNTVNYRVYTPEFPTGPKY